MTIEENKKLVLEFLEASSRGDIDAAMEVYADTSINHGMKVTKDQIRMVLQDLNNTFPGAVTEIHTVVADDEWVTVRTTMSGTHCGRNVVPICYLTRGTEPTGNQFKNVQAIHMFRLADGKIIEHGAGRDDLGMHWQIGLIGVPAWYKARTTS